MSIYKTDSRGESGFTLVELAIVMIIIGLLIGGILKGQQLIANAEIAAGVSQLKGTDSAVSTFRDAYNAFPGDMATPNTRIPNCTVAPCNRVGNANGRLDNVPSIVPVLTNEGGAFWSQLAAADIIGGVTVAPTVIALGQSNPEFEVNGSLRVGYSATGALAGRTATAPVSAGHYLSVGDLTAAVGAAPPGSVLTPGQAFRLDTKIDDGAPNTGSVQGASNGACANNGTVTGFYNTATDQALCDLYMRIQG